MSDVRYNEMLVNNFHCKCDHAVWRLCVMRDMRDTLQEVGVSESVIRQRK